MDYHNSADGYNCLEICGHWDWSLCCGIFGSDNDNGNTIYGSVIVTVGTHEYMRVITKRIIISLMFGMVDTHHMNK